MTYTKPNLTILGDAVKAIKSISTKPGSPSDANLGVNHAVSSAYDLDE